MATYSIRELEEITGVKAHTIRAWEKRYGVIRPDRTCFNVRLYSEEDLQTLSNIAFLNNHGYKISKIAKLSRPEISDHVTQVRSSHAEANDKVDMLAMALMDYDAGKIECIISTQVKHDGLVATMHQLVFPLLDRLGLLLMSGSMTRAHELLLMDIVQQKIRASIDQTDRVRSSESTMLLFSTVPRLLDIHRLYVQYIARKNGVYVIPFLNALSEDDLRQTIEGSAARCVFVLHDMAGSETPLKAAIQACRKYPDLQLVICGSKIHLEGIDIPVNALVLENIQGAHTFLQQLSPSLL